MHHYLIVKYSEVIKLIVLHNYYFCFKPNLLNCNFMKFNGFIISTFNVWLATFPTVQQREPGGAGSRNHASLSQRLTRGHCHQVGKSLGPPIKRPFKLLFYFSARSKNLSLPGERSMGAKQRGFQSEARNRSIVFYASHKVAGLQDSSLHLF